MATAGAPVAQSARPSKLASSCAAQIFRRRPSGLALLGCEPALKPLAPGGLDSSGGSPSPRAAMPLVLSLSVAASTTAHPLSSLA
jgi:hypothetical protein